MARIQGGCDVGSRAQVGKVAVLVDLCSYLTLFASEHAYIGFGFGDDHHEPARESKGRQRVVEGSSDGETHLEKDQDLPSTRACEHEETDDEEEESEEVAVVPLRLPFSCFAFSLASLGPTVQPILNHGPLPRYVFSVPVSSRASSTPETNFLQDRTSEQQIPLKPPSPSALQQCRRLRHLSAFPPPQAPSPDSSQL
ncbi:hypothetical protein NL676_016425 [Syzygium grande]|nr:hypothetical protein NL676_016425 [Syzygium grande]